jgi:hypothetical protein
VQQKEFAMAEPPVAPEPLTDQQLRRFREYVAASIACVIVLGTVIMSALAFVYAGSSENFARAKDLLLFINPFVGVVIGYYFNKVSTEARAENAEATARVATVTAQQAGAQSAAATAEAEQAHAAADEAAEARAAAEEQKQEALTVLTDVAEKAQAVLDQPQRPAGTLGGEGGSAAAEKLRQELQDALNRARRLTR